jgi:PKD repeat protein
MRASTVPGLDRPSIRRLLGVLALLALALLLPAAAQAAEPSAFGELTRFGLGGTGEEQVNNEHIREEWTLRQHLIGVDPTDNSVYVLDEPTEYAQKRRTPSAEELLECEEHEPAVPPAECGAGSGPVTRHFRLRRFAANSEGHYKLAATATFEEQSPASPGESNAGLSVEGIAVDAKRNRVYVLAVDDRKKGIKVDETGQLFDLPVASTLFAFEAQTLAVAGKTGKHKEILAGPTELGAQSATPGVALLEPAGIAVDPENGNVVVMAHVDPSGGAEDRLAEKPGKPPTPDHFVLQRISATTGEFVPEAEHGRWLESGNAFKSTEFSVYVAPTSPVVVGAAGAEQVDMSYEGSLWRVPAPFAASSAPEKVFPPAGPTLAGDVESVLPVRFEGRLGGELSVSPFAEGTGNTIYAPVEVSNEQPGISQAFTGVMALSSATNQVVGWTGGQSLFAVRSPGEASEECVLDPGSSEFFDPVAAGSGGKLFVLAPEYLYSENGVNLWEGPNYPSIVEFGPGGKGCPPAKGGGVTAEVNGELVGTRTVSQSELVDLSSYVNQADAIKTEWDFGDGTSETVTGSFHCPASAGENRGLVRQCPSVSHVFKAGGELTVVEKVHTDNLATPVVTQETKINVSGGSGGGGTGPVAVPTGPRELEVGKAGLFDARASFDLAGPNEITEYHWTYGDGAVENTKEAVRPHAYAALGEYDVLLTVTDGLGLTSLPSKLEAPVKVVPPPPQLPPAAPAGPSGQVNGFATNQSPQVVPNVRLRDAALTITSKGTVVLRLYCPAGETTCSGSVTLRALVAKSSGRGRRAPVNTLIASGPFAVAGGSEKRVVLRVSARVRAALAQHRRLTGQVKIDAHDTAGATHESRLPVLVTAVAPKRRRGRH